MDGPDSETPSGHWFTILNYVSDHTQLVKRFKGEGRVLDDLEWSIKSYFALGGAMHDAAISAWSIKDFYDYLRPISAIRFVGARGQSSNIDSENYDADACYTFWHSINIIWPPPSFYFHSTDKSPGPTMGSRLSIISIKHGKTRKASVGLWLKSGGHVRDLTLLPPPSFFRYISGHSTFSRATAEVLTLLTGDEFFREEWESLLLQKMSL